MKLPFSRRDFLKLSAATGAYSLLSGCGAVNQAISTVSGGSGSCAKITDVEPVVILIHENRSVDHDFGSYNGVNDDGNLIPPLDMTVIDRSLLRTGVSWNGPQKPGSIVVNIPERHLNLIAGEGRAPSATTITAPASVLPIPTASTPWRPPSTPMARTAAR